MPRDKADPVPETSGKTGNAALRVLVVLGHPRGEGSLCGALARRFEAGARAAGCDLRRLDLSTRDFDPNLTAPSPRAQALEPALAAARADIEWAEHLVFVYPTWWGTYPALMKGFLDRILQPGWAFEEIEGGTGFAGRLGGRTAELITTMDTPAPVQSLINKSPGRNAMARATLGFCGIDTTRHSRFGPVNSSTLARRADWLERAEALGRRLSRGPRSARQRVAAAVAPWLKALRLQFYPMTFFAYLMGALLAAGAGGFDHGPFWLGYLFMFALEAATVFSNDLADFETDRRNRLWGPFNGGSRILHGGALSRPALRGGAWAALVVAAGAAGALVAQSAAPGTVAALTLGLAVLALGYSLPPLKLSYRTLGELDVGVTHSVFPVLLGAVLQGGAVLAPLPWLVALPLFLSILPAIVLSGVPDRDADRAVGKATVAVRFGIRAAFSFAIGFALAAAAAALLLEMALVPGLYGWLPAMLIAAHAALLALRLSKEKGRPAMPRRIDASMVLALSFILWFCLVPLFTLPA